MKLTKKVLCLLLIFIISMMSSVTSTAYTTDDVVKAALELIYNNEGSYTSVNADDVGAVSIGRVGWHANRALALMKTIVSADPEQAREILGDSLYNEISGASSTAWRNRTFSSAEKKAVQKLLATDESIAAQDALAYSDIKSYVTNGQSIGIEDGKVLVYFADLENQMSSLGAERVAEAAADIAGSMAKIDIEDIYKAALDDSVAGNSPTRRKSAYNYCRSLDLDAVKVSQAYETGKYKIVTKGSPLNVRSGPGTGNDKVTSVPKGTVVTVTSVSGDWGKISYNGKTGWINLLYAEYIQVAPTVTPDVNENGKVDAGDARLALRAAANVEELSSAQKKAADTDSNGKITAADARVILRIAAKVQ